MKANSAPAITPGSSSGRMTLKNVRHLVRAQALRGADQLSSKPDSAAVTVMTTNGVPSTTCAMMIEKNVLRQVERAHRSENSAARR